MRNKIGMPSPAMVVALLALCVALGGTGYAATKINGKNIRNGTITGKKIKNRTITSAKISRTTVRALKNRRGLRGPRGFRGRTGPRGTTGAGGTALAYARVAADGTVDTARAKAIAASNVTHPGTGVYCFVSLGFSPKNVVATLEQGTSDVIYASIPAVSSATSCPAGAVTVQVKVGGSPNDGAFYVAFN